MRIAILVFVLFIVFSCSPHQKAMRLARQGYAKIEQAKILDPSVINSIKGVIKKDVILPGDTGSVQVSTGLDSAAFKETLRKYDSIKEVNDMLDGAVKSHNLTAQEYEDYIGKLKSNQSAMKAQQARLIRGFAKDSTYRYEDSLQDVTVELRGGQLTKIAHIIKPRTVTVTVPTEDINLNVAPAAWKQSWFWYLIGVIGLLILIIIILAKRR